MSFWKMALGISAGLLVGFAAGSVAATLTPEIRGTITDAKAELRVALGLPKMWRPLVDPADRRGRTPVDCPDPARALVIVTGGQSNAASTLSGEPVETLPRQQVYTFFDGACFLTADPVLGASGIATSLWPEAGIALAQETGRPVLFIHGALGGTQASDWLDPRSGYLEALLTRVRAAEAEGYAVDWIVWHQGETDAAVLDSAEEVETNFTRLTEALLDGLSETAKQPRLYLFRASRCIGDRSEGVAFVIEGLTRTSEADPRIVTGMDTDALGDDFRHDGCHFNSLGKARIVERLRADLTLAE